MLKVNGEGWVQRYATFRWIITTGFTRSDQGDRPFPAVGPPAFVDDQPPGAQRLSDADRVLSAVSAPGFAASAPGLHASA
jgi:hypothetical protein